MERGLKIYLAHVAAFFLLVGGFFGTFVTLLMGGQKFFTPLFIIVVLATIAFIYIGVFQLMKKTKHFVILVVSFYSIVALTLAGYFLYQNHIENLRILSQQDVDLSEYEPFAPDTKVATLDEEATFKMDEVLLDIDGATAFYPMYSAFARAVYPENDYPYYNSKVMSSQTDGAYWNLAEGLADIVFAFEPSSQQRSDARYFNNTIFDLTPIGKEAFVFFVHVDNPVESLTVEQIHGIYSGEITNWSEVGGNDEAIRAYQRPENSGSQQALRKVMENVPLMEPPTEDVVAGMGGIIQETAEYRNYENSIGYSFRYFASEMVENGNIRFLKINDVEPTKETVRDGSYPFVHEFYAVKREGSDNPLVDEFIEWILSDQGQQLVEKSGYVGIHE